MARLFQSGFELNSTTSGVEWDLISGSVSVSTLHTRTGTYAGRANPNGSAKAYFQIQLYGSNSARKMYVRAYVYLTANPSALFSLLAINNALGGGNYICRLDLNTDGTLAIKNGSGTQIGSASSALSTGQWYRVELSIDNTVTNGTVEGKLNGTSFASGAGNATSGTTAGIAVGPSVGLPNGDIYFDDIAVNDDTGSFQTSYPGNGQIVHLQPNAAGDNNAFTVQVGGTAGSTNNYTRVNEITPDDVTSYNGDTASGDIDDFNLTDTPGSIGTSDTINTVMVGVRYQAVVAAAESPFAVRIKKTTGGTVTQGTIITPNSTTWKSNANAIPIIYPLITYQDPDSGNWTKTTLDSAQAGYKITSVGTNATNISTLWVSVDSTPAVAVAKNNTFRALLGIGQLIFFAILNIYAHKFIK